MAHKSGRGGKGSNQYVVKAPTAVETEAHNERVRKMKSFTEVHRPGGATKSASMDNDSLEALTGRLSHSYDAQINLFLSGRGTPADMLEKVEAISAFEDGILSKHNDAYGHALVQGINFVKDAKYNPEIREALKNPNSPERVLLDGYSRIISDAVDAQGEKLTLEELPEILDRLNDASIARERGESWGNERRSEPTLSSRFAATSVFCSRDPKDHSLRQQLATLRNQLHERGVSKIDI